MGININMGCKSTKMNSYIHLVMVTIALCSYRECLKVYMHCITLYSSYTYLNICGETISDI